MRFDIRHVILDRDGVLNVERGDGYIENWSQWRWVPGALESLARLSSAGVSISVATNQSCVGRGILGREELDAIHARMIEEAARKGGKIDRVFVCPHAPMSGCGCRKPAPGMLLSALDASRIPRHATIALGDDLRDLEAAWAAHIPAALVRTGKGAAAETAVSCTRVPVFADLREFTSAVLSNSVADANFSPV